MVAGEQDIARGKGQPHPTGQRGADFVSNASSTGPAATIPPSPEVEKAANLAAVKAYNAALRSRTRGSTTAEHQQHRGRRASAAAAAAAVGVDPGVCEEAKERREQAEEGFT